MNALTLVKKVAVPTLVAAIAISLSAVESHAQNAGPGNFGGGQNMGGAGFGGGAGMGGANFGGKPNMGGAGFGGGAGMGGAGMEIFGGAKADDKSDEYVYEYDFSKFEAPKKGNAPSAAVPEPTSTAGLLVISAFGATALIKRKQRLANKA